MTRTTRWQSLAVATLACSGIAACAASAPRGNADAAAVAEPKTIAPVLYTCADGRRIEARYDNTDRERPTATLVVDGRSFEMYSVVAASGARYATESGLQPGHGLQWWTHGDRATLSAMLMDHTAGGPVELTTCTASRGS